MDMVDTENQPDRYLPQGHGKRHACWTSLRVHVIVTRRGLKGDVCLAKDLAR